MTTARQQTLVVTEKRLQHEVIIAEPPQRAILAAGQQGPRGPASPSHWPIAAVRAHSTAGPVPCSANSSCCGWLMAS